MSVTIYTTDTCHFCHMAKDYLKSKNVKFKEINVGKDPKAAREMIEKTGQMGVPVIEINGKIIIGFNRMAIDKALSEK